MRRLALVGLGRMGRAVEQLAAAHGFEVVARLGRAEMQRGVDRAALAGADVAIEFTTPDACVGNVLATVDAGCPIVVGTTGWYAALPAVQARAAERNGAVLWAPNFALGVNAVLQVLEVAGGILGRLPGFDAHLIETHHTAKKDAPSGTGLAIAAALRPGLQRELPITSVRTGAVPGTHELVFDAPFEQIRLEHVARDRRVFAEGALVAARWLLGRRGVFTMRDVLTDAGATPSSTGSSNT